MYCTQTEWENNELNHNSFLFYADEGTSEFNNRNHELIHAACVETASANQY